MIRWNGTAWEDMNSPYGAGAIAAPTSNNVFGVGADIFHWNGSTWSIADSLNNHMYPALHATTILPDGEIWAAGRDIDADNVFHNLVYRSNQSFVTGLSAKEFHQPALEAYPNPFSESFSLQITSAENADGLVTLTDCLGRVLLSQTTSLKVGTNKLNVAPVLATSGIYMLNVHTGGAVNQLKIVRE